MADDDGEPKSPKRHYTTDKKPDMSTEVRVAVIETEVKNIHQGVAELKVGVGEIRTDMRDARERLKGLEVRVEHLPSKDFVVKVVLGGFAAIGTILSVITLFQSKLQAIFGLTH
jgi:hypothetical protein